MRKSADAGDEVSELRLQFGEAFLNGFPWLVELAFEVAEGDCGAREALVDVVVQFTRDPAALAFLGFDQTPCEFLDFPMRASQRLFRRLQPRDVGDGADHTDGSAVRSVDDRRTVEHPADTAIDVEEAVLDRRQLSIGGPPRRHEPRDVCAQQGSVFRMHDFLPVRNRPCQVLKADQ